MLQTFIERGIRSIRIEIQCSCDGYTLGIAS